MDLYAASRKDDYTDILKETGLDTIPRIRGCYLMDEVTEIDINESIILNDIAIIENFISDDADEKSMSWMANDKAIKRRYKKYLIQNPDRTAINTCDEYIGINWNNIHGKLRKKFKYEFKKLNNAVRKQYEMYNKYAGRKDILYVHASLGGDNWDYFNCDNRVANRPNFITRVDDCWDDTYCDLYFKVGEDIADKIK